MENPGKSLHHLVVLELSSFFGCLQGIHVKVVEIVFHEGISRFIYLLVKVDKLVTIHHCSLHIIANKAPSNQYGPITRN